MTEPRVDPALFRLRVFEDGWLSRLAQMAQVDRESTEAIFSSVLIAEAERWLEMGKQIGYFADEVSGDLPEKRDFDEDVFFPAMRPPGLGAFASLISQAQADFTPERQRFTYLLVFAAEEEWENAIGRAMLIADALEERPWVRLPDEEIDGIGWCLEGAVKALTPTGRSFELSKDRSIKTSPNPAGWRMFLPSTHGFGQPAVVIPQRWAEAGRARRKILAAADWRSEGDFALAQTRARPGDFTGGLPVDWPTSPEF